MIRTTALVALLLAAPLGAQSAARRLSPVDQCSADRGFVAFLAALKQVLFDRDREALLEMMATDVVVSFGGAAGRKDFVAAWNLERRPEFSRFWRDGTAALEFGCARIEKGFVAPSIAWQLGDDDEPFELAVARPGAMLKSAPRDDGADLLPLDWHLVKIDEPGGKTDWIGVTLSNGRKGYVHHDYLRSPLDFHFAFEKRAGRWMITAFVAGD